MNTTRTLSGLIMVGLLNLSVPLGMAATPSLPSSPQGSPVVGSLMTRADGDSAWKSTQVGSDVRSQWFKTDDKSEAVIAFAGDVHMRLSPGTVVHVESSSDAGLRAEVTQGDVLTSVPDSGKTAVQLTTPNGNVNSSAGSFIVKVENKVVNLEVLEGSANLSGEHVTSDQIPGVAVDSMQASPGLIAEATNEDQNPDDENVIFDDQEEDQTALFVGGGAGFLGLIALLAGGGGSGSTASGPGTPASP